MNYTINKSTLYSSVEAEMSMVADEAYGEDGQSLYDEVVLTDKDKPIVEDHLDDALTELARRMSDVCTHGTNQLVFNVSDMPSANVAAASAAISRYAVLFAVAAMCQKRRPALVAHFSELAKAALEGAIEMMRTRNAPSRT